MDDGSKSVEQSVTVLRGLARQGVTAIALTPHLLASQAPFGAPPLHDRAFAALIAAAPPEVTLHRGAEVMLDRPLDPVIAAERKVTLNGSRYILVEFPRMVAAQTVEHALALVVALYSISFWLPQIMQSTSGLGSATIVLLSAIPYMAATAGLVVIGTRSDRTGERRWHLAIPCLIGAAGFVLTVLVPATLTNSLITLSIAAFGIWGTLGPLWTWPTSFLRGTAAAGGIALVNSIGNVGGFAGPFLMGWIRDATGGFSAGFLTLAGFLVAGAIIAALMPRSQK